MLALLSLVMACSVTGVRAQLVAELYYGVDRNVDSGDSEVDGWMNGTVEWLFPSGLGLGLGTDHHFENVGGGPSDHEGWAIYVSSSREFPMGRAAPFVRAGIGLGRAPCEGDTCTDGLYLRGSTGLRFRVVRQFGISAEIGVTRVSRPFGGLGVSVRF